MTCPLWEFGTEAYKCGCTCVCTRYQNGYTSLLLRSICLEYIFPSFYAEVMSIPDVEVYFLDAAEGWVLFCSHSINLCLLLGNWDHWYWEISMNRTCWRLLFCWWWWWWWRCCVLVFFFPFGLCVSGIIYSLYFLGCSYPL